MCRPLLFSNNKPIEERKKKKELRNVPQIVFNLYINQWMGKVERIFFVLLTFN